MRSKRTSNNGKKTTPTKDTLSRPKLIYRGRLNCDIDVAANSQKI